MVPLGSKVRDLITGLEGVAIGRSTWLYGCVRIGVEPLALKDGKPAESVWLDEQRMEVVPWEKTYPVHPTPAVGFALGDIVRDTVTGFTGMAVASTVWASGVLTISIEPNTLHAGEPVKPHTFDIQRVELVQPAAPPVSRSSSATSGGPQADPAFR